MGNWTTDTLNLKSRVRSNKVLNILSQLYIFNYFSNIPTNAHNIYTIKSTKIYNKNTQHSPLHVSVSF
jgi:hypothetical protein